MQEGMRDFRPWQNCCDIPHCPYHVQDNQGMDAVRKFYVGIQKRFGAAMLKSRENSWNR